MVSQILCAFVLQSVLKRSIQKSFSSIRYYHRNKVENPKPPAPKKNPLNIPFQEQASTSNGSLLVELQSISGSFKNTRRIQWLIQKTFQERNNEFMLSDNKLDTIRLYPHFKDAKMVSHNNQFYYNKHFSI